VLVEAFETGFPGVLRRTMCARFSSPIREVRHIWNVDVVWKPFQRLRWCFCALARLLARDAS